MPLPHPVTAELICHRKYPSQAIRNIQVGALRLDNGAVGLRFVLDGELSNLSIPTPKVQCRADGLWERTCFEAFVAPGQGAAYREFNFSPSGEWAAYAFQRYRKGEAFEHDLQPIVAVQRGKNRLELDAIIGPSFLPDTSPKTVLRLACSAVIEDAGGALSYWALRHPSDIPDFHHPDSFALTLNPADETPSADAIGEDT